MIGYLARAEQFWQNAEKFESNIDRAVDHYAKVAKTQAGIIEAIKKMADVMAEAAIASEKTSEKALGDSTDKAISEWTRVMATEARRLVREKKGTTPKEIESGTVIDQEKT